MTCFFNYSQIELNPPLPAQVPVFPPPATRGTGSTGGKFWLAGSVILETSTVIYRASNCWTWILILPNAGLWSVSGLTNDGHKEVVLPIMHGFLLHTIFVPSLYQVRTNSNRLWRW